MKNSVLFYATYKPYGEFSNFSRHPIDIGGMTWPTSEHYFQAQKFTGTPFEAEVRAQPTPMLAAHWRHRRGAGVPCPSAPTGTP